MIDCSDLNENSYVCPGGLAIFMTFPTCDLDKSYCVFYEINDEYRVNLNHTNCSDVAFYNQKSWDAGVRKSLYESFVIRYDNPEIYSHFNMDPYNYTAYDESFLGQNDGCLWDCQPFYCDDLFHSDLQLCPRYSSAEVCFDACYPELSRCLITEY